MFLSSVLILCAFLYVVIGLEVRTRAPLNNIHEARNAALYWTPAKMKFAISRLPHANSTSPGQGIRDTSNGIPFESYYIESSPISAVGRLFYTSKGQDYSCSASVAGPRVLWTAAHCVYDGVWATNVVFAPGYCDGDAPFGSFAAHTMVVLDAWMRTSDFAVDFGNVILVDEIDEIVGRIQTRFNYDPRRISWSAMGYPSESPFDGNKNYLCNSEEVQRDYRHLPPTLRIGCDAGGGTSGGPWLIDYAEGEDLILGSVTSYKYNDDENSIYGPFFGDDAKTLFQIALQVDPNI
eukprot:Phypoly_transcript_14524.p1 GENE.Phypoly_transcript_14524~~Phypoly_transcript_14524.p1  ORF type:complete len:293 (+),score=30.21 Phypoly_transcript_14524:62-940(+)